VINYQGDLATEGGGFTATTPVGPYTYGTTLPSAGFNVDGSQLFYQTGVTPQRFDRAIAGSNFRLPGKTYSTAGDDPIFQNHYKDFEATLDQQLGDFTLELAIDRNVTRQQTNTERSAERERHLH